MSFSQASDAHPSNQIILFFSIRIVLSLFVPFLLVVILDQKLWMARISVGLALVSRRDGVPLPLLHSTWNEWCWTVLYLIQCWSVFRRSCSSKNSKILSISWLFRKNKVYIEVSFFFFLSFFVVFLKNNLIFKSNILKERSNIWTCCVEFQGQLGHLTGFV